MIKSIKLFLKKETVLIISFILAFISCFIIPPDKEYFEYIDIATIIILFCLMLVVSGLKEIGLFEYIGEALLNKIKTERQLILVLVFLCFFTSMFITNDVALITFVPLGILILNMSNMNNSLCLTITLMTISANLGSMLTPIGNPQNLYLYSISNFSVIKFILIMLPYAIISAILLFVCIWFTYSKRKVTIDKLENKKKINNNSLIYYIVLFCLCILTVIGLIPDIILFIIILISIIIKNKTLLLKIDYSLLLTFICFFIFVGNINRITIFYDFITNILNDNVRIVSIFISQIISNVPTAFLLSGFTQEWRELIIGTNIGGLGTLIASMASLISYKQIIINYPSLKNKYLAVFTLLNIIFLVIFCILPI